MNGRTLKFTWLVVGLALAVYFGLAPVPARAEPNASPLAFDDCGGINVSAANPSYEQQVVELVNAERANQGLPPLKRSTSLDSAARAHAEDMGRERYMTHDSQNPACVWSARVAKYYSNANSLAENIASGYSTPQDVMDGWMNSAGHRANILSASNWEIGVGYYPDGLYGTSWVQDFGRRSSFPPLVINRESAATTSPNITCMYMARGARSACATTAMPGRTGQPSAAS